MNDLSIDVNYINNLSSRIDQFKKVRRDLWNGRCPMCGDSKSNKFKKRFYVYLNEDHYSVICHNCENSFIFSTFLKVFYPDEYKRYILEKLPKRTTLKKNRFVHIKDIIPEKVICKGFDYSVLKRFDELSEEHPARKYVENRQIPFDKVYYCENFSKFIETLNIEKYILSYKYAKEPRMIIPFYREDGLSTVFQGRSFSKKDSLRYITIKEDEGESKIYGLDRVDKTKPVYAVEGPIDSLFMDNCISMSGISTKLPTGIDDFVFVFDNEPRNVDVVKNMRKRLLFGYKVFIWPDRIKLKDLNDLIVKGGMSREQVKTLINENLYTRNEGIMRLNEWSK